MFIAAAFVFGALFGILRARKRGGNTLDKVQYGAVHAIIFALVALLFAILVNR